MADELLKTFKALKKKIKPYEKKLKVKTNYESRYELEGKKPFTTKSKKTGNIIKKDAIYFCGLIIQSSYVGFYFMPPYSEKDFMKKFTPELNKRLKGKSCFHFKKAEDVTPEIDKLLKAGFAAYKKKRLSLRAFK